MCSSHTLHTSHCPGFPASGGISSSGDPPRLTEHLLTPSSSKCLEMKQIAEETSFALYECARVNAVLRGNKIVSIIEELEVIE